MTLDQGRVFHEKASAITPVACGVDPVTISMDTVEVAEISVK